MQCQIERNALYERNTDTYCGYRLLSTCAYYKISNNYTLRRHKSDHNHLHGWVTIHVVTAQYYTLYHAYC